MKPVRPLPGLLIGGVLSILAAASSARGQTTASETGVYTLDGGVATQSAQTYAATEPDQSGIYVLDYGNLILASPIVTKVGSSSNVTTSSYYGDNAGVLVESESQVTIYGGTVSTNASGANALFATGTGAVLRMSDGSVTTTGSSSFGTAATYEGEVILNHVNITTGQTNCPALSAGEGGGTMTVTGGTFLTEGTLSPDVQASGNVLDTTGIVSVTSATLTSREGPGAILDGPNAISLTDCELSALLDGVDLEQTTTSFGHATAAVTVDGGSLTAMGGDLFHMTSDSGLFTASITLQGGATVSTSTGNLVNASDESRANFLADGETLTGNLLTDDSSTIAATIQNATTLAGHINTQGFGSDSLTIDGTSTWNVSGSSVLSSLSNAGTVAFTTHGLTVGVSGGYTQASSGKLLVMLDGTTAGTSYDQLAVTGAATLAGTLEVETASGFTPQIGETFNIVTYGSESGSFATLSGSAGLTYTVSYGSREATITITGTSTSQSGPTIINQPESVKARPGAEVTFSVTAATRSGKLKYQWYDDGRAIDGATGASYTLADVTAADVGSYHVIVRAAGVSVTSATATLKIKVTVAPIPVVTVAVQGDGEIVEGGAKGVAVITRTGSTAAELKVHYQLRGTAVNGEDYVGTNGAALPGAVVIPAGSATVKLKIVATSGSKKAALENVNVVLTASPAADYTLGAAVKAKLELIGKE